MPFLAYLANNLLQGHSVRRRGASRRAQHSMPHTARVARELLQLLLVYERGRVTLLAQDGVAAGGQRVELQLAL